MIGYQSHYPSNNFARFFVSKDGKYQVKDYLAHETAKESLLEIKKWVDKLIEDEHKHRGHVAEYDRQLAERDWTPAEYVSCREKMIQNNKRIVAETITEIWQVAASFFPPIVPSRVREEYLRNVEMELERLQREVDKPYLE